ncbi:hypothetical protein [Cellulophaga sp. L1A9]|nr:hypothetical protein [Cellulophaga sp. L1A9]
MKAKIEKYKAADRWMDKCIGCHYNCHCVIFKVLVFQELKLP